MIIDHACVRICVDVCIGVCVLLCKSMYPGMRTCVCLRLCAFAIMHVMCQLFMDYTWVRVFTCVCMLVCKSILAGVRT